MKFFNNIRNDHSMRIFQPKGVVIVSPDAAFGSPVISIKYDDWYVNSVRMQKIP